MLFRAFLALLTVVPVPYGAASPLGISRRGDDLQSKIDAERKVALQGVLDNIGPDGSKAPGASAGAVVASPSTVDPNYFYTWTRDSALTLKTLVDEFLQGSSDLQSHIEDYIKAEAIIQTVSNPSGSLSTGRGLGEPKFYLNLTRFTGSWGRPQRDGPALRATTLITYSRWLLSNGGQREANNVWGVIHNDLDYVAQYWNQTGFDLWEEVSGSSFFTVAAQHRALVEGAALAQQLGQDDATYDAQAKNVLCFLQSFWNGKYIVSNINTAMQRSGIDANSVLSSINTFDPLASCDDTTFQPCSPRALANLKVYVDSFRTIYTINNGIPENEAAATGRYAEDVYYEGNPWYLTTLAVSEQLYSAIQQWKSLGNITVTDVDLPFWQAIYGSATTGTYSTSDSTFDKLINATSDFADGFVEIVHQYLPSSGAISEQFSKENGTQVSAVDLTWSYASYLTATSARAAALANSSDARKSLQVPSWGASNASQVPSTCNGTSFVGKYVPATAAGAPAGSVVCAITVDFDVSATTYFGENLFLTGNTTDLGNWNPAEAIAGSAANYTTEKPLWTFEMDLEAGRTITYGYLRLEENGTWLGEKVDANRTFSVPDCGSTGTKVLDDWIGPNGTAS